MTIKEALNIYKGKRATNTDLFQATVLLKARYSHSAKAFEKRGIKTPLMKSIQARMETRPELFKTPLGKLNRSDLYYVFDTFRQYSGNSFGNEWNLNKTATYSGYKASLDKTGNEVLGNANYSKWSEQQRQDFWSLVDTVRERDPNFFGLGSPIALKEINNIVVNQGISDVNEITSLLEQKADSFITDLFDDEDPFEL